MTWLAYACLYFSIGLVLMTVGIVRLFLHARQHGAQFVPSGDLIGFYACTLLSLVLVALRSLGVIDADGPEDWVASLVLAALALCAMVSAIHICKAIRSLVEAGLPEDDAKRHDPLGDAGGDGEEAKGRHLDGKR